MHKAQRLWRGMVGHLFVELLQMLVMPAFAEAMRELLADEEDDEKRDGESDAPDRRDFLREQVDDRCAQQDQEDCADANRQIDVIADIALDGGLRRDAIRGDGFADW